MLLVYSAFDNTRDSRLFRYPAVRSRLVAPDRTVGSSLRSSTKRGGRSSAGHICSDGSVALLLSSAIRLPMLPARTLFLCMPDPHYRDWEVMCPSGVFVA